MEKRVIIKRVSKFAVLVKICIERGWIRSLIQPLFHFKTTRLYQKCMKFRSLPAVLDRALTFIAREYGLKKGYVIIRTCITFFYYSLF